MIMMITVLTMTRVFLNFGGKKRAKKRLGFVRNVPEEWSSRRERVRQRILRLWNFLFLEGLSVYTYSGVTLSLSAFEFLKSQRFLYISFIHIPTYFNRWGRNSLFAF